MAEQPIIRELNVPDATLRHYVSPDTGATDDRQEKAPTRMVADAGLRAGPQPTLGPASLNYQPAVSAEPGDGGVLKVDSGGCGRKVFRP